MINIYNYISKKGWIFFQLGIFLLLSAPTIGAFFLILSLVSTHLNKQISQIKKKWIIPFFISGLVAIISSLFLSIRSNELEGWDSSLSWIGLMNWIPFFYFMWRSQFYLNTTEKRQKVGDIFLAGSVPLILSGFSQVWLNWNGPFVFMNGLIIWFQRSIDFNKGDGMTAMFNNQNYTAAWLIIVWPFCIYSFLNIKKMNLKKLISFFLMILLAICIYLTQSRNAILSTLLSSFFIIDKIYLLITISSLFVILLLSNKLFNLQYLNLLEILNFSKILNEPRVYIYLNALPIIFERPFLGWGAASFSIIFKLRNPGFNREPTHAHNLIFEMANSYGILFSLLISLTILLILFFSYKIIFLENFSMNSLKTKNNLSFDKAWWSSFFALSFSQMYDIQYFDFRISVSFWILLTGLVCIIQKNFFK